MLKPSYSNYTLDTHLLKSAVVLIDTREQENKHIIDYFEKKKIAYKNVKLDFGDYTLMLPKNEEYGIMQDLQLDFAVERKHKLDELSNNFAQDRNRIEEELWRGNGRIAFIIEDGSIDQLLAHDYRSEYNEKAFLGTMISFAHRYNVSFNFVSKEKTAQVIYAMLYYKLREELK